MNYRELAELAWEFAQGEREKLRALLTSQGKEVREEEEEIPYPLPGAGQKRKVWTVRFSSGEKYRVRLEANALEALGDIVIALHGVLGPLQLRKTYTKAFGLLGTWMRLSCKK